MPSWFKPEVRKSEFVSRRSEASSSDPTAMISAFIKALSEKRKALDVPVEREQRIIRGDERAVGGKEREADNIISTDDEFRFGLRRQADDSALARKRSGDIQIARAIEGDPLRATQSAIKDADFTGRRNPVKTIEARRGGAGNV